MSLLRPLHLPHNAPPLDVSLQRLMTTTNSSAIAERLNEIAPPPIVRSRNLDFPGICEIWVLADHWPLEDAVRLLRRQLPQRIDPRTAQGRDEWREILLDLARNCAGESLPVLPPAADESLPRVRPAEFIAWAQSKGVPIPEPLQEAIAQAEAQQELQLPIPRRKASDLRRERCRAVAQLQWEQQPLLTLQEMVEHPLLFTIGCEGRRYHNALVKEWIADLAPSHPSPS